MNKLVYTKFVLFYAHIARTLFDTGASHCFISQKFLDSAGLIAIPDGTNFVLSTPVGTKEFQTMKIKGTMTMDWCWFPCECIVVDMTEFDILIGMEWFNEHKAIINNGERHCVHFEWRRSWDQNFYFLGIFFGFLVFDVIYFHFRFNKSFILLFLLFQFYNYFILRYLCQ